MAKKTTRANKREFNKEAGSIRLSQAVFTYGVGSIVDLPAVSVMVSGLDEWDDSSERRYLPETRLLRAIRSTEGFGAVEKLETAPIPEKDHNSKIGVPVTFFPRWLHCSICHRIAPIESGEFEIQRLSRGWAHKSVKCNRSKGNQSSLARPVRFIAGCKEHGHMEDFPWNSFVHEGNACEESTKRQTLRFYEFGASGEAKDVNVRCEACGQARQMSFAFDERVGIGQCSGKHPHLSLDAGEECLDEKGRPSKLQTMLESATNTWFPVSLSALTIPREKAEENEALYALVERHWNKLAKFTSTERIGFYLEDAPDAKDLKSYKLDVILAGIDAYRASLEPDGEEDLVETLKAEEWNVLTDKRIENPPNTPYRAEHVDAPNEFKSLITSVTRLKQLREVRALLGFTRILPPGDSFENLSIEEMNLVPISKEEPFWLPASEALGEGIFIRFDEEAVSNWETVVKESSRFEAFRGAHEEFARARNIDTKMPAPRYILLHSFSHALIRQISLDCGYATASIRERLYAEDGMAGVLLYTSASDSEGTLGGLVSLGRPEVLGQIISRMLEELSTCSSDPLCSEHKPTGENEVLHGAACHTCLFVSETSCERGNRYLDRSALVATLAEHGVGFPEPYFS